MEEIEIKFAVKDTEEVAQKLRMLGFRVTVARHLEQNYMFDDAAGTCGLPVNYFVFATRHQSKL